MKGSRQQLIAKRAPITYIVGRKSPQKWQTGKDQSWQWKFKKQLTTKSHTHMQKKHYHLPPPTSNLQSFSPTKKLRNTCSISTSARLWLDAATLSIFFLLPLPMVVMVWWHLSAMTVSIFELGEVYIPLHPCSGHTSERWILFAWRWDKRPRKGWGWMRLNRVRTRFTI